MVASANAVDLIPCRIGARAYRPRTRIVTRFVGTPLDWMMLAGLALMGAGGWLLWAALRGRAGRLAHRRVRRRGRGSVARLRSRPPRISRSSLLDPTVNLNPVPIRDPISGRQVFVVPPPPIRLRTPRAPNPARFGAPYGPAP